MPNTDLDNRALAIALDLIDRFGAIAKFSVDGLRTYDPATGNVVAAGTSSFERKMAPPIRFESKMWDGETIRATDLKTIIAASGIQFTPRLGMIVLFKGQEYSVTYLHPLYSGEAIAAWELGLRL